ncbi:Carbon monoxide dehydrogenase small chain [bioreactor metagenome]|uniref:Carbon monoxide dehydrogenase small chain n=1 Tax=bioreactor metagenome TaxID=1076179 RepID=A0A644XHM6_9ZZZZ
MNSQRITFTLNGKRRTESVDPVSRALDLLREELGLTGTKDGCGVGECGACTIVVNGLAVNACMIPAAQLDGADVLTVAGLKDTPIGRALQSAFVSCGAVQCGFCTPGMLLSAYALLLDNPLPKEADIRRALAGNLCRCTGYQPIIEAVQVALNSLTDN